MQHPTRRALLSTLIPLATLPLAALAGPQGDPGDSPLWARVKPSLQAINSQVVGLGNPRTSTPEALQVAYTSLDEARQLVKTLSTTPSQRERFDDWYVAKRAEAGEAFVNKAWASEAAQRESSKAWDRMRMAFND